MRNRHSPINPRRCSLSHDGRQAAFLSLSLSFSLSLSLSLSLSRSLSLPRDPTQSDLRTRLRGWHGEITAPSVVEERYIIMHYAARARARARSLSLSFSLSLFLDLSAVRGGNDGCHALCHDHCRSSYATMTYRGRNCCASQRYRATRANVPRLHLRPPAESRQCLHRT